jgi:hypothetical protein
MALGGMCCQTLKVSILGYPGTPSLILVTNVSTSMVAFHDFVSKDRVQIMTNPAIPPVFPIIASMFDPYDCLVIPVVAT